MQINSSYSSYFLLAPFSPDVLGAEKALARAQKTEDAAFIGANNADENVQNVDAPEKVEKIDDAQKTEIKAKQGQKPLQLTPEEEAQVAQLKSTDREVRAHEQAHIAAGGALVKGAASFTYQVGPDNQRYAIGGEVSIDTSAGKTPRETIQRAQRIQAAALAPANPSSQDYSVAAAARQMMVEATMQLSAEQREKMQTSAKEGGKTGDKTGEAAAKTYQKAEENPFGAPKSGTEINAFA